MDFSIFIELYSLDHYLCCAARHVRLFVTVWAAGGQAARLFYPWDFSGKYTGVGCHFLLHYLLQNIFITPRGTPSPHSLRSPSPWQPPTAFCPDGFSCSAFHLNGLIQRVAFFHWASCLQGSSMLQPASVSHSFLWLSEIPLCGYVTFCLPICLVMDIWTFPTFWLLWLVLPWTFTGTFLCSCMSSLLLCSYLGLKFLGHTATACLMFFRNYQSVSIASTLLTTSLHLGLLFCQMEIIRVPALLGSRDGMQYCRQSPPASSLALHQSLNEC